MWGTSHICLFMCKTWNCDLVYSISGPFELRVFTGPHLLQPLQPSAFLFPHLFQISAVFCCLYLAAFLAYTNYAQNKLASAHTNLQDLHALWAYMDNISVGLSLYVYSCICKLMYWIQNFSTYRTPTVCFRVFEETSKAVLPNLCSAARSARAAEVCRGRIPEIKSFQWEVSMKFQLIHHYDHSIIG